MDNFGGGDRGCAAIATVDALMTNRAMKLAKCQHGLVWRHQLVALGINERTVHRRVDEGMWIPYGRSVLRLVGWPDDLATRSIATGMRLPGSVLAGVSAAAVLGSGPWDTVPLGNRPWVISGTRRQVPALFIAHPGVRVKNHGLVRVTGAQDAVVDLLRFLPPTDARTVAYRALQTRAVSLAHLLDARERLRRHCGVGQLGSIIEDISSGARSQGETVIVSLLHDAGFTGWSANFAVRLGGRLVVIDVAFPELRLAIEVDGRAWHSDAGRFQSDRRRQNALVRAGWTVLRFTWDDLTMRPDRVIAEIRQCGQRLAAS